MEGDFCGGDGGRVRAGHERRALAGGERRGPDNHNYSCRGRYRPVHRLPSPSRGSGTRWRDAVRTSPDWPAREASISDHDPSPLPLPEPGRIHGSPGSRSLLAHGQPFGSMHDASPGTGDRRDPNHPDVAWEPASRPNAPSPAVPVKDTRWSGRSVTPARPGMRRDRTGWSASRGSTGRDTWFSGIPCSRATGSPFVRTPAGCHRRDGRNRSREET